MLHIYGFVCFDLSSFLYIFSFLLFSISDWSLQLSKPVILNRIIWERKLTDSHRIHLQYEIEYNCTFLHFVLRSSLVFVSNYLTFQVWGGGICRRKQNIQIVTERELELMITESELANE